MLSGGEQQRVALARALAPRPAVLLMDEPFSGLDSRLKDSVRAETLAILRESRATAIVVTHDAEEAMRMGDRIALLKDGRLVQAGTGRGALSAARRPFRRRLLLRAQCVRRPGARRLAETPLGTVAAPGLPKARRSTVAVRTTGFDVSETAGEIEARILSRRYLGVVELLELAVPGAETPVARTGALRRFVPQGARHLAFVAAVRRTSV